jgi:hypothetical protein
MWEAAASSGPLRNLLLVPEPQALQPHREENVVRVRDAPFRGGDGQAGPGLFAEPDRKNRIALDGSRGRPVQTQRTGVPASIMPTAMLRASETSRTGRTT